MASLSIAIQFAADAAFADNRIARAKELLREVPEKHRAFDWHHRMNHFTGGYATLFGHTSRVASVAFSPDGTRIVSGSWDTMVKVWDAASGAERATLKGHTKMVESVAFSPDGTRIVSGSSDTTVKIWDAASGAERATLKGHSSRVTSVAFSPDGTRIVSGSSDATVKIWDVASEMELNIPSDVAWLKSMNSKHPTKNTWLHREGDNVVLIDLTVSERDVAFKIGRALFRPFEAKEEYENAKKPYAKAFWKGQFVLNLPNEAKHWDEFKEQCIDEPTWRLMIHNCDLVLQKGSNERSKHERAWAEKQLQSAQSSKSSQPKP